MSPAKTPLWWATVGTFALAHFFGFAWVLMVCLTHYYDKPCPFDQIGLVLAFPAYFFAPLFGRSSFGFLLLPLNSFVWGCVLAEPFRWWFGWPAWQFSLRTLLLITTSVAILLGLSMALKGGDKPRNQPVVQAPGD